MNLDDAMRRTLHAILPLPADATPPGADRLRWRARVPALAALAALTLLPACTQLTRVRAVEDERTPTARAGNESEARPEGDGGTGPRVAAQPVPATPVAASRALPYESGRIRLAALQHPGLRVVVSIEDRALWLMEGQSTLMAVPVAVGKEEDFVWDGRTYDFDTPTGIRRVASKAETPLWVPPDWHYLELAAEKGLQPVSLEPGAKVALEDSTRIEVRGKQVGRVNAYGNFWPFTPGSEIIFDGKIFIPPFGTDQRRVPAVLGTHKLDMGDGYLLHGTNEEGSIGDAVSHGCVRLHNDDVAQLYARVPVGTPVFIY